MFPVYLRREPTNDSDAIRHGQGFRQDVVAYSGPSAASAIGRFPWHYSTCSKHEIEYEIFDYDDIEAEGKSRDEATAIVSKRLRRYDRRACDDV